MGDWAWLALVVACCGSVAALEPRPLVMAHRGASGYRPEHTLAAYELAIEMGADFVELDLQITKDGVLIARHENEISETTDVAEHPEFASRRRTNQIQGRNPGESVTAAGWFTEDFTLAEIKTLRAKERLKTRDHAYDGKYEVATLREALDLVRAKSRETGRTIGVYIETKHPAHFAKIGLPLEEPLVRLLKESGMGERGAPVFLQSFDANSLKKLKRMIDVPLVQLLGASEKPDLAEITTYAAAIGPDKRQILPVAKNGDVGPPTTLVEEAHRAGLRVHPYTFRSDAPHLPAAYQGKAEAEYEQFFKLGVDGVFSDFPDTAVRVRDRMFRR